MFVLSWFRDRPDIRRLGQGSGISQATAYRYLSEAIGPLAAKAPTLREALEKAAGLGLPYLILDGTLIASDRCAEKTTSRKGGEIDRWYSGKAHHPAPGTCRRCPRRVACRCGSRTCCPAAPMT